MNSRARSLLLSLGSRIISPLIKLSGSNIDDCGDTQIKISKLDNLLKKHKLKEENIDKYGLTKKELEVLSLTYNSITDISALSNLTNLKHLNLLGNSITDISVLGNMTNLTSLFLDTDIVSDMSVLDNLPNVEINVDNKMAYTVFVKSANPITDQIKKMINEL